MEGWPTLESALYEWIQRAEDIYISGDIIQKKAEFFWKNLREYEDQDMPSFSNGWLHRFQIRRAVKERIRHREIGSVSIKAAKAMISIQYALAAYDPKDVFNCDETGLFWKMTLD